MMPQVSICLPILNSRPFLEPRMASLLGQTYGDWELIVCDSYSDDGSWEYLKRFESDTRLRLHQVPKAGIYAGWNECLRRIRGRYFCFATADDTASPEFLERMVDALECHPDVDIAVCQFDPIDSRGRVIQPRPEFPSDFYGEWLARPHRRAGALEFLVHWIRGGCWTTITSVVFRTTLLAKVGLFEERGTPVVDQFWAAKTALHTDSIWLPDHLATWRRHDRQASGQWSRKLARRQLRIAEQTVAECEPLIPDAWKRDPGWRDVLMWGPRNYYRAWFGLDRGLLRREPRRFLRNLAWSAAFEPGYGLQRIASGLTWSDDTYRDSNALLRDVIGRWHVPWPPSPVDL